MASKTSWLQKQINAAWLRERIDAAGLRYVGIFDGRVIAVRGDGGPVRELLAFSARLQETSSIAVDYTVTMTRNDPTGIGEWGLNVQGWGPWVSSQEGELVVEMLRLALHEVEELNRG